jgi:hypothetical protein
MRSPFVVAFHLGEGFRSCKRVCRDSAVFGKPLLKDQPLPDGVPPQRTTGLCDPCCPLVQAGLRRASLSGWQLLIGIVQRVLHGHSLANCLSRRGAAMKNLSHSASFHSKENIAPSNSGIKHLISDTGTPRFTSPVASLQQIA